MGSLGAISKTVHFVGSYDDTIHTFPECWIAVCGKAHAYGTRMTDTWLWVTCPKCREEHNARAVERALEAH